MKAAAKYVIDSFPVPISSKFVFHCVQGHVEQNRSPGDISWIHTVPYMRSNLDKELVLIYGTECMYYLNVEPGTENGLVLYSS